MNPGLAPKWVRVTLVATALVVALAALRLLTPDSGGQPPASGSEAPMFLLSAAPAGPSAPLEIRTATHVETSEDLDRLAGGPAVVFVDASAASGLAASSLSHHVAAGSALIGINVPLDELSALAGFTEQIAAVNPEFGKHDPGVAEFKGEYFTVLWRTPPDAEVQRWRRSQMDLSPNMFALVVRDLRLNVLGLARDESGTIIPLEEY